MGCFDEEPDGDQHGECAAEIARLNAHLEQCAAVLPGPYYMDPPDGGDVSVSEQLRRMAKDAARYRWLREKGGAVWHVVDDPKNPRRATGAYYDAAVDDAMKTPNTNSA